ncbi:hypothetical protein NCG97_00540 [Streptomyces lydicamycinicus]|uniref:hypothetical protein n=1 Tax=Streptomyces lydicamycinicus TaxID=1546107 RepID=UPI002036495F|nr:hypothetical protein [Streptomyces lydicamycinicus]URZ99500.1 hypothetical protein NCG97_00540 [Streptomyces lydicamycinicus]
MYRDKLGIYPHDHLAGATFGIGLAQRIARRYKVSGGWVAERLGRLKPNGVLYRRSGLSTLIEPETLRLGVEGKTLIWRTLLIVAAGEPRLDESQLHHLLGRARDQLDTLRLAAAEAVFSSRARSVTPDSP